MSRTYKDLPYNVKVDRFGKTKKTLTEDKVIDNCRNKRIVAIFYANEIAEIEKLEEKLFEIGAEFKVHEVNGSLNSFQYLELSEKDIEIERNISPLIDYIFYDRISVNVEGQEFKVKPILNTYSKVYSRATDNYRHKPLIKHGKTNFFKIYEIVGKFPPSWSRNSVTIEKANNKELTYSDNIYRECRCEYCSPTKEDLRTDAERKSVFNKVKKEYNSSGEILEPTEDIIY